MNRVFSTTPPDEVNEGDLIDLFVFGGVSTCIITKKYKYYWNNNQNWCWSLVLDLYGIEECANWSPTQKTWIHREP